MATWQALGSRLGLDRDNAPPALVAVAHGSRDPRSAATVAGLVEQVRRLSPGLDVRLSFLDLNTPRLPEVLAAVAADGHRRAVVVPLLLGDAYHARVDIPNAVRQAVQRHPRLRLTVTGVLGDDPRLASTAVRRLAEATEQVPAAELGVVVAATGSSRAEANNRVRQMAATWADRHGWRSSVAAFATATTPTVGEAVAQLHTDGARHIAVASWFLAPGLLPNRVRQAALAACPKVRIAAPLGADPQVAEVVVDRYLAGVTESEGRRAS